MSPARLLGRERAALALLAFGTVAFMPGALNRFVFAKVALIAAGAALAFTVPARGRLSLRFVAIVAVGALILLVATMRELAPLSALVGLPPRYEGVFVLPVYVGAAAAGARLLGPNRAAGSTAWFLQWLAIAAVAVGFEASLELAGLRPLASNVARPGSLLGNASDEGAWAVLVLGPLAAVAARTRRWPYIAGAIAAAVTLVASGSRGALVGGVVVALVLAALAPRRGLKLLVLLGLALIAAGSFLTPSTRNRVVGASPYSLETVRGRELLWSETLRLVADHPYLGVGLSGYINAIPAYHDLRWELEVGPANPPDSPHNWILQAAADGGLPLTLDALALALVVLLGGLAVTRRQRTGGEQAAITGMLAGVAGYGVALLFHLTSPGTTPLAATLVGALVSVPVHPAAATGDSPSEGWRVLASSKASALARTTQVGVFGALSILLLLAALAELPLRSAILNAASGRLSAANAEFHLAANLRPWDPGVAATAGHAFAVLAAAGEPGAARLGVPWTASELGANPDGVGALEDAAAIDAASARLGTAGVLLARAVRLDPTDPAVLLDAGRLDERRGDRATALRLLQEAAHYAPTSTAVRDALNAARR